MSHFSLLQLVLSGIEGEIFTCHQDLWIGRLNDRNLGFRGEILNRWQGWQRERKYHLVCTSFYSWVCVKKGYDNGREIGELKVDLRSLIFYLEDFFFLGAGVQFSCALLLGIEDWILNCWVGFWDSEFDMSSLRYCDVSTLRCCASSCTVQGEY